MDTSFSDDKWGARCHRIFHSGYSDHKHAFRAALDCVTG